MVVIYNRVPKTGSTSFVGIAYELYAKNRFHVLHVNVSRNKHVLSVADQVCTPCTGVSREGGGSGRALPLFGHMQISAHLALSYTKRVLFAL